MDAKDFIDDMSGLFENNNTINPELYDRYNVKSGLRNNNGTGVAVGLTEVSSVIGYIMEDGIKKPTEGKLYYRGIAIRDLVKGCVMEKRRGFEETAYLLLFGELPTAEKLKAFNDVLDEFRELPMSFTENMILKIPSNDIMNKLQRSILVLYSHDENPDDTTPKNLLLQSIMLIARFPTIVSYGYQAKAHYFDKKSLFIHSPKKGVGTAENILHMIRPDNEYTETEASVLDLCLLIHADHGGGNNSAFATHVVSSSGTDTYSAIAAAVGCLKGPKHGGANVKVREMIDEIKENCNYSDRGALKDYLVRIVNKEAGDRSGLIYGMGHAVYTLSDSRAEILKKEAAKLALEKDNCETYQLYKNIEELTKEILMERKGKDAMICANVDLYSGLVYEMLNIPKELYTPIFAVARVAGWCSHRMEQVMSDKKIIRPAYKYVRSFEDYVPLESRVDHNAELFKLPSCF
ncbi:MAG: citrate/2-methylcitrate synthase [Peptostreptococcaceae bacterium]|nr:citrate/2-methylcitrate synthase [Peptostreptococcaceae bacterium]